MNEGAPNLSTAPAAAPDASGGKPALEEWGYNDWITGPEKPLPAFLNEPAEPSPAASTEAPPQPDASRKGVWRSEGPLGQDNPPADIIEESVDDEGKKFFQMLGPDGKTYYAPAEQVEEISPTNTEAAPQSEELADGWTFSGETTPSGQLIVRRGSESKFTDQAGYEALKLSTSSAEPVAATALPETPVALAANVDPAPPPNADPIPSPDADPKLPDDADPKPADGTDPADDKDKAAKTPEAIDYNKLRDLNTDPRLILKLKEKIEGKRAEIIDDLTKSTRKIVRIPWEKSTTGFLGTNDIFEHLQAQGLELDENGDLPPEAMAILFDMSTMMDLSVETLQGLKSTRVGDDPPLEIMEYVPGKDAGASGQDDEGYNIYKQPRRPDLRSSFRALKSVIAEAGFSKTEVKAKVSKLFGWTHSGGEFFNKTKEKFLALVASAELKQRRRALLGYMAGSFATAGSAYLGIDRRAMSDEKYAPFPVLKMGLPPLSDLEDALHAAEDLSIPLIKAVEPKPDIPAPPDSIPSTPPSRVERFGVRVENGSARARRVAVALDKIQKKLGG